MTQQQLGAAGWYTDPDQPGRLRYFDGLTWTQHVHDPGPPSAPAYPAVVAPSHSYQPWASQPPRRKQTSTTPARIFVIAVVTIGALWGVGMAFHMLASGLSRAAGAAPAQGPTVRLTPVVPSQLDGLPVTTDQTARLKVSSAMHQIFVNIPGAQTSYSEVYATAPGPAAVDAELMAVGWAPTTVPIDQDAFLRGMAAGSKKAGTSGIATVPVPDDARMLCSHQAFPQGLTAETCMWVRSGTGLVVVMSYDVSRDHAIASTMAVVRQLELVAD